MALLHMKFSVNLACFLSNFTVTLDSLDIIFTVKLLPIRYIFVSTSAIQPLFHGGMPKLICLYFKGRLLVKTLRGNEKLTAENLSVATCLSSL